MTHIYLIRHAESVLAHTGHIIDIMKEDRLTPEGVQQAERLRDRLTATGEIRADVLLASSFPRAHQTAEIVAPALGLPVILDDDLQEMRPGDSGGMYWDEYDEKYGRSDFIREPFRTQAPGAENLPQFTLRVAMALHRISQEYAGKTVAAVCHGGIIDCSILCFLGVSMLTHPYVNLGEVDNTSITHWEHFERDGVPRWRLLKYNDAVHLHHNISNL